MRLVNMHEAKTHLSRLVDAVAAGEEIVIARAGKPVARLVAYEETRSTPRPFGLLKSKLWMSDDIWEPEHDFVDAFWERAERPVE